MVYRLYINSFWGFIIINQQLYRHYLYRTNKVCVQKRFWVQIKFGVQKNFESQIFWIQNLGEKNSCPKNNFPKKFWCKKTMVRKNLGPKEYWVLTFFGSKNNLFESESSVHLFPRPQLNFGPSWMNTMYLKWQVIFKIIENPRTS